MRIFHFNRRPKHFENKLCNMLYENYEVVPKGCRIYTIWRFNLRGALSDGLRKVSTELLCQPTWYPTVHVVVCFLSVLGVLTSLYEFLRLFTYAKSNVAVWHSRKYYVFSKQHLRYVRLIGSLVDLSFWLLLVAGLYSKRAAYILPWLTVNSVKDFIEISVCLFEFIMGWLRLDCVLLLQMLLSAVCVLFVYCVYLKTVEAANTPPVVVPVPKLAWYNPFRYFPSKALTMGIK